MKKVGGCIFWHLRNNQEMVLVSNNIATCTGDKTGDGEALAFDNNHNHFAFNEIRPVVLSKSDQITVLGELNKKYKNKLLSDNYYNGFWIYIVKGKGLGQARKVESYTIKNSAITFKLDKPWNIKPDNTSYVSVGLGFWQLLVLNNIVDHRDSICLKSNRISKNSKPKPQGGGQVGIWAQATDSVIAGNSLYDTTGIIIHPFYSAAGKGCDSCQAESMFQYFLRISKNRIESEYDWSSDCSWSGLTVSFGAAPIYAVLPTIAYGLEIRGNEINQADGLSGGAISIVPSWWDGPKLSKHSLINNTIISRNIVRNMSGSIKKHNCNRGIKYRSGINLGSNKIYSTILRSNVCLDVDKNVIDNALHTKVLNDEINMRFCK